MSISFDQALQLDDFSLLSELLSGSSDQRYALAKLYAQSSGLPDVNLAGFLCDAIMESLQINVGLTSKGNGEREVKGQADEGHGGGEHLYLQG